MAKQQSRTAKFNALLESAEQSEKKFKETEKHADAIDKFYNEKLPEIQAADEKIGALNERTKKLNATATEIEEDVQEKRDSINELHVELLGGENEDGEEVTGMQAKLNSFYQTNLAKIKQNQAVTEKNQRAAEENNKETKKILKGAITVTLAANFQSAKRMQIAAGWAYTILFFGVIAGLVFLNWWLLKNPALLGSDGFWASLLPRTTLSFPFIWVAWHCQRMAAESYRIGEEYHHKQRVMELYVALTDEHSDFQGDDDMSELEKIVTEAIQKNPAKQLKNPSMPGILSNLDKTKDD